MNKFIVPEQDIDRLAIEEAVRNDAWLILPECVDSNILVDKANDMGFGDVFKCTYLDYLETKQLIGENIVFIYPDRILEEFLEFNNQTAISMFMESDVK